MTEALLGFLAIFVLALMRMPLAFSMGLVGIAGIGLTRGWMPAMASTAQVVHETGFEPPVYVLTRAINQLKKGVKELGVKA